MPDMSPVPNNPSAPAGTNNKGFQNIDKAPGGNLLEIKQEGGPRPRKTRIRKLLEMGIPKKHITRV